MSIENYIALLLVVIFLLCMAVIWVSVKLGKANNKETKTLMRKVFGDKIKVPVEMPENFDEQLN